jgi:hypothetical protein
MKVEQKRPDLILCDDIEPDESSYSPDLAAKRKTTLIDAILPLNIYARVVICGTVTMPGASSTSWSGHARGVETAEWIRDEGVRAHYTPPIVERPDGYRAVDVAGEVADRLPDKIHRHTRSSRRTWRTIPWRPTARCGRRTTSATRHPTTARTRSRT